MKEAVPRRPSYPPLEGEGRPSTTKHGFVVDGRGGVTCSSAALPHPRRTPPPVAFRFAQRNPTPPPQGRVRKTLAVSPSDRAVPMRTVGRAARADAPRYRIALRPIILHCSKSSTH